MPVARLSALDLHFLDVGPAEAREVVLLLHAFPLAAAMWRPQIAALAGDFRVVAPDLRGFGGTPAGEGPSTMAILAGDALALLDALGISRVTVVGLSMGGYVALEVLRRAPERVRALVLADTRAGADDEAGRAGREAFAVSALAQGGGWVADAMVPRLLREGADPEVEATVRALIRGASTAGVAAAQRGMALRPDSTLTLATIAVPTLVIVGALDRLTPPEEARRMAEAIPGAELVEIPGAAHLANLEAPEPFNRALMGFLERIAGAASR